MNKEKLIAEIWQEADADLVFMSAVEEIINKHLEGMAIVPIEPTDKMLGIMIGSGRSIANATITYQSMLKACEDES